MTKYATWAGYSKKKDVSLFPVVDDKEIQMDWQLFTKIISFRSHSFSEAQDELSEWIGQWVQLNVSNCLVEYDKAGNLYITKGDASLYPCVIAHLDINQDESAEKVQPVIAGDWLIGVDLETGKQTGIGADDKNGIIAALLILQKIDNIKVFFPVDEEVGCAGTSKCDTKFFGDCTMLLQGDRNAYSGAEFCSYSNGLEICSDEFMFAAKDTFDKYGYYDSTGIYTDVGHLKGMPGISCIGMNLTIGYFDEHCDDEVTYIPALENAINFMYELIRDYGTAKWHHVSPQKKYTGSGGWGQKSYFKGDKGEWDTTSSSGTKKSGEVKVGDTVKVISESTHKGRIAKVTSIMESEQWPIEVHFGEGKQDWACYDKSELEVLNTVPGKEYKDWEDWEEIDEAKGKAKKEAPAFGQQWINGVQYAADKDVDYDEAQEMIDSRFCPCCEKEDTLTVDIDSLAYCHSCHAYYNIPEWYSQNQEI